MSNDNNENISKAAGKASNLFFILIVAGCLLPIIVICVGSLFSN